MEGKTLSDEIDLLKVLFFFRIIVYLWKKKDKKTFEPEIVKEIMFKLMNGCDLMHDNFIIHRDLKPDNLMFSREGDFTSL